jgi:hypothetical protein
MSSNPYEAPQERSRPVDLPLIFWLLLGLQGALLLGTLVCVALILQHLLDPKYRHVATIGTLSLAGATLVGMILLITAHRYSRNRWAMFEFLLLILLSILLLLSLN